MRLAAVLAALPEGYEWVRGERGWLAFASEARATLEAVGFGPDGGEELPPSDLSGRHPLRAIHAGKERWLVRRFHHGGWSRVLGERLFLRPARPFEELRNARALAALGIDTPRVIAARALRDSPCGWRLTLVSARVEGVLDGGTVLERWRHGEWSWRERARFVEALGGLVGRLHAARFLHADLHPRNLLIDPGFERAWVLDLDQARFVPCLSESARRANLRRLLRAVRRRESRAAPFLTRGDYRRFLKAYAAAIGVVPDWRGDWRAIERLDRSRAFWHRLGWWLEARLGSGPERRDGGAWA